MAHTKSQAMLQVARLLDFRDLSSPFTLILDSLEQPAKSLTDECIKRASGSKTEIIYVSYESIRRPSNATHFIPAYTLASQAVASKIRTITTSSSNTTAQQATSTQTTRLSHLLILDTLHPLASDPSLNLPSFLTSLLTPTTALLCVYHVDQPLSSPSSLPPKHDAYIPTPLTHLCHIATTILTVHSPHHILASRAARARAVQAPRFGLEEDEEGILVGLGATDKRGTVVEIEMRRKSGRSAGFLVFLPTSNYETADKGEREVLKKWGFCLMEDCILFKERKSDDGSKIEASDEDMGEVSFNLGLTAKQRRDREGVVLPYFDAQSGDGVGSGGRILYEMGEEDDFDEEEDEI